MYLIIIITNRERSFFQLKLIKNLFRTSMLQSHLNNLTLTAAQRDILRALGFDGIIDGFDQEKTRKVSI